MLDRGVVLLPWRTVPTRECPRLPAAAAAAPSADIHNDKQRCLARPGRADGLQRLWPRWHRRPPPDEEGWQTWEKQWHAALEKYGRNPADYQTNGLGHLYVTDDPEREWAKHKDALLYRRNYKRFNGSQPYVEVLGKDTMDRPEDLPNWESLFMTPEEAVKRIRATYAESAPDEMRITADNPGIPLRTRNLRSLRRR